MSANSPTARHAAPPGNAAAATLLEPVPRRILVREVNWLGDLVMSLPALRAIRRAWPDAHVAVLVRRELAGFFDGARWIDEVIPFAIARGIRGIVDRRRVIRDIRAGSFDLAILFPTSFESALWVTMAGVPRRAGYSADARSAMLTLRALPPAAATVGHQVHFWLQMVRATVGAVGDASDFAIAADEANLIRVRTWLASRRKRADGPLVAIAPAAAYGPAKEWPAQHFARLIDHLAEHIGTECVLVGAPGERARCEQVAATAQSGAIVAAGETNVAELLAILAIADGFVGNDSGAMHVSAALGKPTVGIFGSTNPMRTAPMGPHARVIWHHLACSPCLARTCRFGHYDCLREITPDEVAAALREAGCPG
jgi:lipopolysaccharide heptosyltransferase II